jgi:hypothetical protein
MLVVSKIFVISINKQDSYKLNIKNISFVLDNLDFNYVGFINYDDKIKKEKLV